VSGEQSFPGSDPHVGQPVLPAFPPPPPGSTPEPGPVPPIATGQQTGASRGRSRKLLVGLVVAALVLAGVISVFVVGGGDDSSDSPDVDIAITVAITEAPPTAATEPAATEPAATEPDAPAETEPDETEPAETEPAETEPTETSPPESTPPETEPSDEDGFTTINGLLAWTSFDEEPLDDAAQRRAIDQLIADRTVEAVAHPTAVSTICAGVPVDAPLDFTITWHYLGETVQADERSASPPGVGSCIDNDGEALAAGSYQVFTSNDDGSEIGNATTFVIGADTVAQSFVNNTDDDLCEIGVAPIDTSYYELFVSEDGNIGPGELIIIDIASVEQDLLARRCDGSDVGALTFVPDGASDQALAP